ncbi:hypothetical protein EJ02DRAFT_428249 [Clathrospora elynae]|uniref:Dynactin subunit 4 n=1 Tax=Clathrospora elynae TaxID=706981 RepID=A0A6A5S4U8_9PLEO|nr:hypothetical protein EJ02DRAFT_428249 [Clathrospora elynae]
MAQAFPYTYYACDCFDSNTTTSTKRASQMLAAADEEDSTFDPQSSRSNYALYPLEHLLYCEDCQQIRCPRCIIEETLNWYCPNCLFEVPSSVVKSDGNRCTRNCFQCPVCISPLIVNVLDTPDTSSATPDRHILACPYCHWSTIETGIEFEKHTGVYGQLARIANGGRPIPTPKERDKEREKRKELEARQQDSRNPLSPSTNSSATAVGDYEPPSRDEVFSNLAAFYKCQIEAQKPPNLFASGEFNFSSPSAHSRIMNLYSTTTAKKQKRAKPATMREAASELEGLTIHDPASDNAAIERIKRDGWSSTLSPTQKLAQTNPHVHFEAELRPIPTLLCTKRSKRCRSCRHILSKPESKITSTRYKIKLLALNHIPRLSIRALPPTNVPSSVPPTPGSSSSSQQQPFSYHAIRSGVPTHFLLHLSNPLFDPIRVTLATSSTTPGKVQSRVTILCPQFDVGANTDVWDDALSASPAPPSRNRGATINAETGLIEAGKVWDKGRNWTSVVVEVVPGFLQDIGSFGGEGKRAEEEGLNDDDDLLEIPIFVRLEFEADVHADERGLGDSRGSKGEKERREEAFWTVVGAGRIKELEDAKNKPKKKHAGDTGKDESQADPDARPKKRGKTTEYAEDTEAKNPGNYLAKLGGPIAMEIPADLLEKIHLYNAMLQLGLPKFVQLPLIDTLVLQMYKTNLSACHLDTLEITIGRFYSRGVAILDPVLNHLIGTYYFHSLADCTHPEPTRKETTTQDDDAGRTDFTTTKRKYLGFADHSANRQAF